MYKVKSEYCQTMCIHGPDSYKVGDS